MNIAYTKKYKAWREKYNVIFSAKHRIDQPEETTQLNHGFFVHSRYYAAEVDNLRLTASDNELKNANGQTIYIWRNLDTDGEFFTLFQHSNGKHYLVFRTELYGYSVFETESGREFHYIPSQAHPEENENSEETFIWTDVRYHAKTNLLSVSGCFWACPSSTLILDFSDPLQEQPMEKWLDLHTVLDCNYDIYDDIDFDYWDDNGDLWLKVLNANSGKYEKLSISKDEIETWMI